MEKSSKHRNKFTRFGHRPEHWYRDNSVYFITARVRDQLPAFASEEVKSLFWDRFQYWTRTYPVELIAASLLNNHYHLIAYIAIGRTLPVLMQRLHGSVAKHVNDLLPQRIERFWFRKGDTGYFDGCLRDETQLRRTFRYVTTQSNRHRLGIDPSRYAHTRIWTDVDEAVDRAHWRRAYMEHVPYKRYS